MPRVLDDDARERVVRIVRMENQTREPLASAYWFSRTCVVTASHFPDDVPVDQLFVEVPFDQAGHAYFTSPHDEGRRLAVSELRTIEGKDAVVLTLADAADPPLDVRSEVVLCPPLVASQDDVRGGMIWIHGYPSWWEGQPVEPSWSGDVQPGSGGATPHVVLPETRSPPAWKGLSGAPVFWRSSTAHPVVWLGLVKHVAEHDSGSKAVVETLATNVDVLEECSESRRVVDRRRAVADWQQQTVERILKAHPALESSLPSGSALGLDDDACIELGRFVKRNPSCASDLLDLVAAALSGRPSVVAGLAHGSSRVHQVIGEHVLLQSVAAGVSGADAKTEYRFTHRWIGTGPRDRKAESASQVFDPQRMEVDLAHQGIDRTVPQVLRQALQESGLDPDRLSWDARVDGCVWYFSASAARQNLQHDTETLEYLDKSGTVLVLTMPGDVVAGSLERLVLDLLDRAGRWDGEGGES